MFCLMFRLTLDQTFDPTLAQRLIVVDPLPWNKMADRSAVRFLNTTNLDPLCANTKRTMTTKANKINITSWVRHKSSL